MMWRDGERSLRGRAPNFGDLDSTPVPGLRRVLRAPATPRAIEPHPARRKAMLPIETARGCWYGMKNHCTFCGLNRAGMDFRCMKPGAGAATAQGPVAPIRHARLQRHRQHPRPGIHVAALRAARRRTYRPAAALRDPAEAVPCAAAARCAMAGWCRVQPGIESFCTHVLTLMRKNITGSGQPRAAEVDHLLRDQQPLQRPLRLPWRNRGDYRGAGRRLRKHRPSAAAVRNRPGPARPRIADVRACPTSTRCTVLRPSRCYRHIYPADHDLARSRRTSSSTTPMRPGRRVVRRMPEAGGGLEATLAAQAAAIPARVKTWESVSDPRRAQRHVPAITDSTTRTPPLYEQCTDARTADGAAQRARLWR